MLERSGDVHNMTIRRSNGRRIYLDHYRWAHALPLRDGDDAVTVDWCELVTTNEAGKTVYRNSFASSLSVSLETAREIVAAGRAGRSRTRTTTRSRPRATASSTTSATASST